MAKIKLLTDIFDTEKKEAESKKTATVKGKKIETK